MMAANLDMMINTFEQKTPYSLLHVCTFLLDCQGLHLFWGLKGSGIQEVVFPAPAVVYGFPFMPLMSLPGDASLG